MKKARSFAVINFLAVAGLAFITADPVYAKEAATAPVQMVPASFADLAEKLGIPITGPQKEDQFWIELLPKQSAAYGFTPARTFTPDRWLEDGDTVTVGKVTLQVIHTPGHTPGHVVFYQPEQKFALVGDVIFNGSIGRTDFPRGNHQQLINSIRGKLFPLGDEVEFVCGHGPNSTFGRERQTNPFVADHRG